MQREAVLEVQIEDEREREREHQHRHGEGGAPVRAPVAHRAEPAEEREHDRDDALHPIRPVMRELPAEILRVVDDLRPIQRSRVTRVPAPGSLRGIVEDRRLAVLHAENDVPQRPPGGRLPFVDRRMEAGANREIGVDRQPHDRDEQRRDRERGVAGRARVHQCGEEQHARDGDRLPALESERHEQPPHTGDHQELRPLDAALGIGRGPLLLERRIQQDEHHRPDEHAHHVVRRGQGEQIDDQQQVVIVCLAGRLIVPAHDEPQDQRDGEQAERVDLLVDDRLVPHRERGSGDEGAGQRRDAPRPQHRHERAEPALGDEEPATRRDRAREGGEQIDPLRVGAGNRQQAEHVRHEDEQRIARRVRDAQRVRRRDVFRRIPELRRRCEREDIENQRAERHAGRHQIWRLDGGDRRGRCGVYAPVCGTRAIRNSGRHRPV